MQLLPQDIIVRKDRSGKTVWLRHSFICRVLGDMEDYLCKARSMYKSGVARCYLTRDILPETGKAWRFGIINSTFYYAYANIPDRAPVHYRSQLPSQDELVALADQADKAAITGDLETHFKAYLNSHYEEYLHCFCECTKTQQTNLAKAAAILESAIEWVRSRAINLKKYDFIADFTALLARFDVAYLPHNPRVFKRLLLEVIEAGKAIAEIIKLPRQGNVNASKYDDAEVRSWVLQLRGMEGLNYTNAHIIRKIKDMCLLTVRPAPSDRWIGTIMEQHNTKYLTAQERYGSKGRFSAIYRGYVPLQNALFAGDCWQVDGTRINLVDHKGEDGKRQFLYIIAVRDVHSGDLIGWHFDLKEDRWAVFNALKMAVKETGYLPYEIAFDKFPGHNTPEMEDFLGTLRQLGTKITFTYEAEGKANLERWFGTLQTVFMQDSRYYYGQGIKSRRNYAHRSTEYIKLLRRDANKEGFSWDDAVAETTSMIERYRQTALCAYSRKHSTIEQAPAQLHEISAKPNVRDVKPEDYWYLFGLKDIQQLRNGGLIRKEIQKVEFFYRTTDYEIISKHDKVIVCYDLEDLSQVLLYKVSDGPLYQFLGRAYEETPAQRYGPDAEWGTIAKRKAIIKELEGYREQEQEYRKASGSDIVAVLAPVLVAKPQAERAESEVLINSWTGGKSSESSDGDGFTFNPRNQY